MPSEYLVGHVDNAQTIDLSKLATSSASNELIDCGDLLIVTIETGYEDDREKEPPTVRVGEDGNVQIPLVGPVAVAGMELTAAEQVIRVAAIERGVFRNPNVTVEMKQHAIQPRDRAGGRRIRPARMICPAPTVRYWRRSSRPRD